jgi:hypothetical protein
MNMASKLGWQVVHIIEKGRIWMPKRAKPNLDGIEKIGEESFAVHDSTSARERHK